MKIEFQRRKGEGFILEKFVQLTFSGTVFENIVPKSRADRTASWPAMGGRVKNRGKGMVFQDVKASFDFGNCFGRCSVTHASTISPLERLR